MASESFTMFQEKQQVQVEKAQDSAVQQQKRENRIGYIGNNHMNQNNVMQRGTDNSAQSKRLESTEDQLLMSDSKLMTPQFAMHCGIENMETSSYSPSQSSSSDSEDDDYNNIAYDNLPQLMERIVIRLGSDSESSSSESEDEQEEEEEVYVQATKRRRVM